MQRALVGIVVTDLAFMTLAACGGSNQPAASEPAASTTTPDNSSTPAASSSAPPKYDLARIRKGRIAPAVVQQVVRADFDAMRSCYESGLARAPNLTGKITVRFVIARDGTVSSAMEVHDAPPSAPSGFDGGLVEDSAQIQKEPRFPDKAVESCVVARFAQLQFPKPDGGIVTVVYPIIFSPSDEK